MALPKNEVFPKNMHIVQQTIMVNELGEKKNNASLKRNSSSGVGTHVDKSSIGT